MAGPLWILLYSAVGGINGVIGAFGFLLFRSTTRYVIFLLCIILMFAVKRLSTVKFKSAFTPCRRHSLLHRSGGCLGPDAACGHF